MLKEYVQGVWARSLDGLVKAIGNVGTAKIFRKEFVSEHQPAGGDLKRYESLYVEIWANSAMKDVYGIFLNDMEFEPRCND